MRMDARTNAKRHPDYLPGCDFRTSKSIILSIPWSVKRVLAQWIAESFKVSLSASLR
jgi:hypothetical protein